MRIFKIIKRLFCSNDEVEKYEMIFDWELAARLISRMRPYIACQVLEDSPEKPSNVIYQGGIPVRKDAVHSKIKRPMIIIDDKASIPCFKLADENDDVGPWTKEALKMLEGRI